MQVSLFDKGKSFVSWVFLGPVFMVLTTTIASFFSSGFPFLCALSICFFSTIFLERIGLILSFATLAAIGVFQHLEASSHLWLFCLECSFALGLVYTYFSFLRLKHFYSFMRKKLLTTGKKNKVLEDLLQEEQNCLKRYKQDTQREFSLSKNEEENTKDLLLAYRKLTDIFQKRDKKSRQLREDFSSLEQESKRKILALQYSVETVKKHLVEEIKEKKKALIAANDLRCQFFQSKILSSHEIAKLKKTAYILSQKNTVNQLERKHLEEKIIHGQNQIKKLCLRIDELSKQLSLLSKETKYKELKNQFEEKKLMLHKERQALFQAQEKIAVYEKNKKAKELEFSKDLLLCFKDLEVLEHENAYLRRENDSLNTFVSTLLKKQKVVAVEKTFSFE